MSHLRVIRSTNLVGFYLDNFNSVGSVVDDFIAVVVIFVTVADVVAVVDGCLILKPDEEK